MKYSIVGPERLVLPALVEIKWSAVVYLASKIIFTALFILAAWYAFLVLALIW